MGNFEKLEISGFAIGLVALMILWIFKEPILARILGGVSLFILIIFFCIRVYAGYFYKSSENTTNKN